MRKWRQIRISSLLILVGLVAVCLAVGPKLWWRWRVHFAVQATLTTGPDSAWSFDPLSSATKDHLAILLSDNIRVTDRLLVIANTDKSVLRRINAVKTIRALAQHSSSYEARVKHLPQLIELACCDEQSRIPKAEILVTMADWIPSTGVSTELRTKMLAAALSAPPELRAGWTSVFASIGGRREIQWLLDNVDTDNDDEFSALCNSQFRNVLWPGILPYVQLWLNSPKTAAEALEFSILSTSASGRDMLLRLATDTAQTDASRIRALGRLQETIAGLELLNSASSSSTVKSDFDQLLGQPSMAKFGKELQRLNGTCGDALWGELIDGVDTAGWATNGRVRMPPEAIEELEAYYERQERLTLECIQQLTGNPRLASQRACEAWFHSTGPGAIELSQLLQLVLDRPDFVDVAAVRRRLVPYHLGRIPEDCLPVYPKMLQSENSAVRYWACQAILTYGDSAEARDVLIELVEQAQKSVSASSQPGSIYMLKNRFAVNFFRDVGAWRSWAENRKQQMAEGQQEVP